MIEFRNNDTQYLQWTREHPKGFVLNTYTYPSRNYLILHRATCGTITTLLRGHWTGPDFCKICAEGVTELEDWAKEAVRGTLSPCRICKANPDEDKPQPPTARDFEYALLRQLMQAQQEGKCCLEIRSGDLHESVGGYPGPDHRIPVCCDVLRRYMRAGDEVIEEPPQGRGANLVIRYRLPR